MDTQTRGALESREDFQQTPTDQYRYWLAELQNADTRLKSFRKLGTKTVKKYTGGMSTHRDTASPDDRGGNFRLNLFHSKRCT